MDDYKLQKNELLRLLHTANSEERKQHIQNALDALDKVADNPSLYPAQASHIFHVPVETVTGANARPYSARRRPSIKLHVIPEELAKYRNAMATVEEEHRADASEVHRRAVRMAKITATSCDPRLPPYYLLDARPKPWVSTGLVPHVVSLQFDNTIVVKKLEVFCTGVRALEVRSAPSHVSCPLRRERSAQRTGDREIFVLTPEAGDENPHRRQENSGNDSDASDFASSSFSSKRDASPVLSGGMVNQLHFVVTSLSQDFCVIHRIRLAADSGTI